MIMFIFISKKTPSKKLKLTIERKSKVSSESSSNLLFVKTCRTNIYSSLEEPWIQDNFEKYILWDAPDQTGWFGFKPARWQIYYSLLN